MKKERFGKLLCGLLLIGVMLATGILLDGILAWVLLLPQYFALVEWMADLVRELLKEPERKGLTYEELLRDEEAWYYSRQNSEKMKKLRPVGWLVIGLSVVVSLMNLCMIGDYGFWTGVGILCFLACPVLCGVFPAYFSINHLEGQTNRMTTFPIINMMIPYFLPLGIHNIRSLMTYCFLDFAEIVRAMLLVTAVVGAIMRLVIPEFRRHTSCWIWCLILFLIFSFGMAAPINHIFESQPPKVVTAVVAEYHPGGYKVAPSYTLRLEDGTSIQMDAKDGFWDRDYNIGQTIAVEYHQGALGITYYCYNDEM